MTTLFYCFVISLAFLVLCIMFAIADRRKYRKTCKAIEEIAEQMHNGKLRLFSSNEKYSVSHADGSRSYLFDDMKYLGGHELVYAGLAPGSVIPDKCYCVEIEDFHFKRRQEVVTNFLVVKLRPHNGAHYVGATVVACDEKTIVCEHPSIGTIRIPRRTARHLEIGKELTLIQSAKDVGNGTYLLQYLFEP